MEASNQVVVLVGESTKTLWKFVGWEIDLALNLELPIIVVNLNGKRRMGSDRCPAALRTGYVVHVAYKRAIIKYALESFQPSSVDAIGRQPGRGYGDNVYRLLGIE
jgi:hypothetical protein